MQTLNSDCCAARTHVVVAYAGSRMNSTLRARITADACAYLATCRPTHPVAVAGLRPLASCESHPGGGLANLLACGWVARR